MKSLPKIPENADKLTEKTSVEVFCYDENRKIDMISFLNGLGYQTVSSEDKRAADPSVFVYDKSRSFLLTPFMKPEEVLPFMQNLSQKFDENHIIYRQFKTRYKDQFLSPKSDDAPQIISDEAVLQYLSQKNIEKISLIDKSELTFLKENITEHGPKKLWRGTVMGDAAHTISREAWEARCFAFACPSIDRASYFATDAPEKSRFGFVEEYEPSAQQVYARDGWLEISQCNESINWRDLIDVNDNASETYVLKETNPHLKTYLYDDQARTLYPIYENGKYVDEFLEKYAKSRRPQKEYTSDYIAKRISAMCSESEHSEKQIDIIKPSLNKPNEENTPAQTILEKTGRPHAKRKIPRVKTETKKELKKLGFWNMFKKSKGLEA